MREKHPLKGIISTVNTPFNDDLSVNWEDLRKTAEYALDAGVNGFLAPCLASEMKYLDWDERYKMCRELVDVCNKKGRGLVIPNINADTYEDCVKLAKGYLECGVSGLNIHMPEVDLDLFRKVVSAVNDLNPPFICLQDTKTNEFPPEYIKELFYENEALTSIKIETKDPGPVYSEVLKLTNGEMNICGSWGSDQMIEAYDRGIHCLMPSGLFDLFVNVYRLYHEKSRDAAMKLFFDVLPIIVFTRQSDMVNMYLHKSYNKRLGLYSSVNFRTPDFKVDEIHKSYTEEMIDRALRISANMKDYWK